ncbi:DUF1080 domain-containing protein [Termitidicoccus mucosus]|uniref:family 16 glycoside hydrolase n=1 Tax=Termitidicoccus mucosus TaxID=1184151 RepID=UPI0008386A5E
MKKKNNPRGIALCALAAGILAQAAFLHAQALPSPPAGFAALFNGRDLAGWWGAKTEDPRVYMALPPEEFAKKRDASLADIRAHWRVENGELVNDGQGLYLTTGNDYGDFELLLEYKALPLGDSGVYLRGCPQVQIWDHTNPKEFKNGAQKGSGALWNNSPGAPGKDPLVFADKPFGEWNSLRVIMAGSRVWVWLNGKQTVDGAVMENYYDRKLPRAQRAPVPARGPIQLQTHGSEIRWRDLYIREISGAEATALLRDRSPDGFESVFNGKNLDGWTGATAAVAVKDGAIVWQPKKGGTLYTEAEYSDFVARLEFKLPPGGNNGLAIRYPGKGNPAYAGMCELQILAADYEKVTGQKIDPRQAHGSAYGMVGAHRGYQRPAGEWNYQEVTVAGPTIKVELNGAPILDADLSTVTEFMGDKPHPGKDRASGHFGFAGHNDPVEFRNISIKPLQPIQPDQAAAPQTLRVLCYNIHHGEGTDKKLDLDRIAAVIESAAPDLVAVQEVDRDTTRTGRVDQARVLAEKLRMDHAFGKTINYRGGEYGILILSKFPIERHEMMLLPPPVQKEQRGLLVARLSLPGKRALRFACTHLSVASADERAIQTATINELLLDDPAPVILAGDFNARPSSAPVAALQKHWADTAAPALGKHATPDRENRIDYIFHRSADPFKVLETRTLDEPVASDHLPILAILQLD